MSLGRRQFIQSTVALSASLRGTSALADHFSLSQSKRPNLVFMFSDQQSFDMLGCYGNEQVLTPHTDRLASEGLRFTSCFSNYPVCTPYRGMLMSGQHPLYNGCMANDWQLIPGEGEHFGEVLQNEGYRTGYVGKWHLYGGYRDRPVPPGIHRQGFDGVFLSNNCHVDFRPGHCYYWNENGEKTFFNEWEQYAQTEQALDFLDSASDQEDPFALFVSWHPPHNHVKSTHESGYAAPPDAIARYDADSVRTRPIAPDDPKHRDMMLRYMALCSTIDDCLGAILKKLKDKGLDENTLVVFTSDHGDLLRWIGTKRQMKNRPESQSSQVPMLMRFPKRVPRGKTDLLVGAMDIMPTVLGLLDISIPERVQGVDLSDAVEKGDSNAVDALPLFMLGGNPGWRGIVTSEHLYAVDLRSAIAKSRQCNVLFERESDPQGLRNRFGLKSVRATQTVLFEKTKALASQFGDEAVNYTDLLSHCLGKRVDFRNKDASGALKTRPIDTIRTMNQKGVWS